MKIREVVPRLGKAPLHWLLEGPLIVISIVLGMWVSQYQQTRQDRDLATRVLQSLQREVEHNLAVIEPYIEVHRRWLQALGQPAGDETPRSGFDVFMATRPALPPAAQSPFPFLRRSGWDTAMAGGAIRLIDHDVAAALSDIYRVQEVVSQNVDRLATGVMTSGAIFEPANRAATVRLLELTLADIESAEATVLALYRRHLTRIRAAAAAAPR